MLYFVQNIPVVQQQNSRKNAGIVIFDESYVFTSLLPISF